MLIEAIHRTLGGRVTVNAPPWGLQLTMRLPDDVAAKEASKRPDDVGLIARALDDNYSRYRPPGQFLHLGFGCVPEKGIGTAVDSLAAALRPLL